MDNGHVLDLLLHQGMVKEPAPDQFLHQLQPLQELDREPPQELAQRLDLLLHPTQGVLHHQMFPREFGLSSLLMMMMNEEGPNLLLEMDHL